MSVMAGPFVVAARTRWVDHRARQERGADAVSRAEELDERSGRRGALLEQDVASTREALDRRLRHGGGPHGSLRERHEPVGLAPQQQRRYVDPVQPAPEARLVREAV